MDDRINNLLEAAKKAYNNAYVPNSNFSVGAALLTENGTIYAGANVENACYAMGQCAEASAIGHMITQEGAAKIQTIVVIGDAKLPIVPCGGCLQKLSEFTTKDTEVYCYTKAGEAKKYLFSELQPVTFDHSSMDT